MINTILERLKKVKDFRQNQGKRHEIWIDIGNRDITRIFRLGQHIDKLIRAKTTLKGRKNQDKVRPCLSKFRRLKAF